MSILYFYFTFCSQAVSSGCVCLASANFSHRSLGAAITIQLRFSSSNLVRRDKRKGSAEGMGIGKLCVSSGNIERSSEHGLGKFGSVTRMRDTNDGKHEKRRQEEKACQQKEQNKKHLVRTRPESAETRWPPAQSLRQIARRRLSAHLSLPWTTDRCGCCSCERMAAAAVSCCSTVCAPERAGHMIEIETQ